MFQNREQAGKLLAEKLKQFKSKDTIILAIPRGGMAVAKVISDLLSLPIDMVVVKKLGSPYNPELAIGAVGPEFAGKPVVYWDEDLIQRLSIDRKSKNYELRIKNQQRKDLERLLRNNKPRPILKNKTVILIDDGIATGATVLVAAKYLKKRKIKELILAAPVISSETFRYISKYFDMSVFLEVVDNFRAVGQFYKEFPQVEDEEVIDLLKE